MPAPATLFFLSDYGLHDEFVGVVHAVLRRLAPHAVVIDVTHEVPAFAVAAGARALERAAPHLGPGVVLAVVDPGVGGRRRPVALQAAGDGGPRWLVGPDNGLLVPAADTLGGVTAAFALDPARVRHGPATGGPSSTTFDGRDVFAPAAAALSSGAAAAAVGSPIDPSGLVRLSEPVLEHGPGPGGGGWLRAEVLWVDRFGNVQLAATPGDPMLPPVLELRRVGGTSDRMEGEGHGVAGRSTERVHRVRSFGELAPDEIGLLVDANDHLSLVTPERRAADRLALACGDVVELVW